MRAAIHRYAGSTRAEHTYKLLAVGESIQHTVQNDFKDAAILLDFHDIAFGTYILIVNSLYQLSLLRAHLFIRMHLCLRNPTSVGAGVGVGVAILASR